MKSVPSPGRNEIYSMQALLGHSKVCSISMINLFMENYTSQRQSLVGVSHSNDTGQTQWIGSTTVIGWGQSL